MSRVWRPSSRVPRGLAPTIFFLISFHIVLLDRHGCSGVRHALSSVAGAAVAALLVAKVVLIADKLPIINRFP